MIGVHLSAVNTFSSQVSIPFDISRMPSGYYLTRPCVKLIQNHKHSLLFKKNKLPRSFCIVLVFVNVHFLYTPSLRTLLLSCIPFLFKKKELDI